MGELEDFIGFTIKREVTKTTLNIYQPYLMNNMTQGFNEGVKSLTTFNNPDTPHKGIIRNQETDTKISYNLQKRCRSGVGSLLYLVKHSCTELSNAVRELYKFMNKSKMSHYKALLRAINYIMDTKDYCYQMKTYGSINGQW